MSFNRENTIWQSPDGTWNRGFYEVVWQDLNGDPEWDVEYGGEFWWVSIGHATREAAHAAWDGCNPGGCDELMYNSATSHAIATLDRKAQRVVAENNKWGPKTWASKTKHG